MRLYAKIVPIIVTIGPKIMIFCGTPFFHFAFKNNETYYYITDYFKVRIQKNYCTKTLNYSTKSNYYLYNFIVYSHNNLKSIGFLWRSTRIPIPFELFIFYFVFFL